MIAVDIETFDSNMKTKGDGAHRNDGLIYMVGLYDGQDYVCCKPDDPRLKDWLASDEDKVFHNGVYDLSWLICGYGFKIGGTWHDTMTRCALIDEYMDLDLDSCCKKFKVKGKNYSDTIDLWFERVKHNLGLRGTFWDNSDIIYTYPDGWKAMEKYNEQDCRATYNLFMATEPYIREVQECYQMECDLYPLWMDMKRDGIRFDTVRAERLLHEVTRLRDLQEQQLFYEYHINGDTLASPKKLTLAMNALGVQSPNRTATGAQSWDKTTLPLIDHPVIPMIQNLKNLDYVAGNKGILKLMDCCVNGRIYTTFAPNKRDEGGTITGRLAANNPNLQNIASREDNADQKAWGPEMRSLFMPEEGCMLGAADYGQIEARGLAHFGYGPQAEWFREQIRSGVDYHTAAQQMTGIKNRNIIKRMNFGFIYGMGIKRLMQLDIRLLRKLAAEAGVDVDTFGQQLYETYHQRFPIIKDTMRHIEQLTVQQGYVKSIGGRIHHKPRPELSFNGKYTVPYYRMTNYVIQGSAADILKRGLLDAYKGGVFDVLKMHLTVHDENVVSIPYNKQGVEASNALLECMLGAYKDRLSVPLTVAMEVGPNWGYWSGDIWEAMQKGDFNAEAFNKVYAPTAKKDWWVVQNGYKGLDGVLKMEDNTA